MLKLGATLHRRAVPAGELSGTRARVPDRHVHRQEPGTMSEHPLSAADPPGARPTIPLSLLDLAPIIAGGDAGLALRQSLDLAQHAEGWGYHRYWFAEHHNMPGIASAATAVVIAHVAAGTSTIRIGSGGIMLPNHAPLEIAEQFGTLEALHPGRIDLGIGRAPGTDPLTAQALRRNTSSDDDFPDELVELLAYFASGSRGIRAIPGAGLAIPVWLLGSSLFSARLAAAMGLPYAFAAHFAPDHLLEALAIYRREFTPSARLPQPRVMIALHAIATASDAEAQRVLTSWQQSFLALRRGHPGQLKPPVDTMHGLWSSGERAMVEHALSHAVIGSPDTVARGLTEIQRRCAADEIMVTAQIYDLATRLKSFHLIAELWLGLQHGSAQQKHRA
jgi:luciferase family oxidoreductase group 1